jgi:hypothetical protein
METTTRDEAVAVEVLATSTAGFTAMVMVTSGVGDSTAA